MVIMHQVVVGVDHLRLVECVQKPVRDRINFVDFVKKCVE